MSMFQAGTQVSLVLVLLADDDNLYIVMCDTLPNEIWPSVN